MNKKILKIVIIISIILMIITGIMYEIDLNRMNNNKPVLFSTWGRKYEPPLIRDSVSKDNSSLEDLQEEYTIDKAIEEGCFIITNDNKIYNKDKLDRFIENTGINSKNRIEDYIKIVQFTREGDPIITELSYKIKDETYLLSGKPVNKTTYILKVDNTRDRFADESDRKVTIDENIPGNIYGITEEKNGEEVNINLSLYAQIQYVDSNTKRYNSINICSYSSDFF